VGGKGALGGPLRQSWKLASSQMHPTGSFLDRAQSSLGAAERRRREITVTWNAKGKAGTGGVYNSFRRSVMQIPIGIGYVRSATCWGSDRAYLP